LNIQPTSREGTENIGGCDNEERVHKKLETRMRQMDVAEFEGANDERDEGNARNSRQRGGDKEEMQVIPDVREIEGETREPES